MCDLGVGHSDWSRSQEHHARVGTERDSWFYIRRSLVSGLSLGPCSETWQWETGQAHLGSTWLWVGNLCFSDVGGKQGKAHAVLPELGLFPAQLHQSQITPHHTWQSQLGWKKLVILTEHQELDDLEGSSLLCFENFLRKHFPSMGDFTSWEKSSCWWFTAQISLRSVKSQLDTTMIDFIDFPPPLHIHQAAKSNSKLQCISLCLTSPWDNPFASVLWKLTE